ncbi:MAG: PAS domain S-box protein, partial [Bacteroidota bacterium]|nr:PAS domain S-box protein [Bacteroidota bacterium]
MPENLKEASDNLHHFEALFNFATMGILITNSEGRITAINPFASKEFGYEQQELIGERIEALIPTRYRPHHEGHVENYMKRPQTRPMGLGMDLFALRKNGTEFPVEVSLGNF